MLRTGIILASVFASWLLLDFTAAGTNQIPGELERALTDLVGAGGYEWHTVLAVSGVNSQIPLPQISGVCTSNGLVMVTIAFQESTNRFVFKGSNVVVQGFAGQWLSRAEATRDSDSFGPGMFTKQFTESFKPPHIQALELARNIARLEQTPDGYAGVLTSNAAAELMAWRLPAPRGQTPEIVGPNVEVGFKTSGGTLKGYRIHMTGTLKLGDVVREIDRTVTVEITSIGPRAIQLPEEAIRKLK